MAILICFVIGKFIFEYDSYKTKLIIIHVFINFKSGYKQSLEELQRESNDYYGGRIKFIIPDLVQDFARKKSERSIDGMTYKTYLNGRPASMTEANGSRDCTSRRFIVECVNRSLKRFKLIRETWHHSKIQSQVRLKI